MGIDFDAVLRDKLDGQKTKIGFGVGGDEIVEKGSTAQVKEFKNKKV